MNPKHGFVVVVVVTMFLFPKFFSSKVLSLLVVGPVGEVAGRVEAQPSVHQEGPGGLPEGAGE